MIAVRYTVIAADGTLTTHDRDLDLRAEVGPEGPARVRLSPAVMAAGWTNDCGHLFPEKYPRNITGSCVLLALGAAAQPYAGSVAITGWDPIREIHSLTDPGRIERIHRDVLVAIGEQDRPAGSQPDRRAREWESGVREVAEWLRTCETPRMEFMRGTW